MQQVLTEVTTHVPEFGLIDCSRLRVSASYNRSPRRRGLLAYVLPLKYKDGSPVQTKTRGGKTLHFGIIPTIVDGKEILYIIYFMLPRFMNLSFRDKIETIIHELYHINPIFNGDLRRLKGRSYIHGNSLKEYDLKIKELADRFLDSPYKTEVFEFLRHPFHKIEEKYGKVWTAHIPEPRPKLIHVQRNEKSGNL